MKRKGILLVCIVLAIIAGIYTQKFIKAQKAKKTPIAVDISQKDLIDIAAFKALQNSGEPYQLIDVRQPEEYAISFIDGATLIPLPTLKTKLENIEKDKAVILYCRSGKRSGMALDILRQAGYPKVLSLEGGILAWEAAHQSK